MAKRKPFYGWAITSMGVLGNALQGGLIFWTMGLYTSAFEDEFGASRARITLIETLITVGSNIMSPLVGLFVDKKSARLQVTIGAVCMGSGLILISQAGTLLQVWVVYATLIPLSVLSLGMMPSSALITRWFRKNRGLALGISLTGSSIGGFIAPPVLAFLFVAYGWRVSVLCIGAAVILLAPVFYRLLADFPEDIGCEVEEESAKTKQQLAEADKVDWGFSDLLGSRVTYLQTIYSGAMLAVTLGLLANLSLHAKDLGFGTQQQAFLYSIIAICSLGGKIVIGTLTDRFGIKPIAVLGIACMVTGLSVFLVVQSYEGLMLACVFFGLATGATTPIWTAMISRQFGARSFGRALGLQSPMHIPISAPSAPLAGWISDTTGSYELVFILYLGFVALASLALLLMPRHTSVGVSELPVA